MTIKLAAALLLAGSVAFSACGDGGDTVGETAAVSPELISEGETLYQASCAECHGGDLRGTDKGPSHLSIVYEPGHHADAAFHLAVQRGSVAHHWDFGDMAPVEGLTDEDVDAIIAYVREQQRLHGFEPYPP